MRKEEIAARREKVKTYLQNHVNQWVTLGDVSKICNTTAFTAKKDIMHIVDNNIGGSIETSHQGVMWIPAPVIVDPKEKMQKDAKAFASFFKTEKKEEKTEILFAKGKNSEGYSDPTANRAIRNIEPDVKPIFSGDVWLASRSDGRTDACLVIRNFGDKSLCVTLDKIASSDDGYVSYGRNKIDCTKLSSKPNKYFIEHVEAIPAEVMANVRSKLADILGIEETINHVEASPIDEKKLRAEVRAELEAEYERKLTQQKIDIYERVLFGR